MMVAKAMGKMAMTDVMMRSKLGDCMTANAVRSMLMGSPTQAASLSFVKSTSPVAAARM